MSRTATPQAGVAHGLTTTPAAPRTADWLASGTDCSRCLNLLPIGLESRPCVHDLVVIRGDLLHELGVPLEPRPPDERQSLSLDSIESPSHCLIDPVGVHTNLSFHVGAHLRGLQLLEARNPWRRRGPVTRRTWLPDGKGPQALGKTWGRFPSSGDQGARRGLTGNVATARRSLSSCGHDCTRLWCEKFARRSPVAARVTTSPRSPSPAGGR
jgi:hypothetical protein